MGEHSLIEIKCPNTATHIETLLGAEIPEKYRLQMQWQMACTGRTLCDFVSYDPRLPEDMQLYVVCYPADPAMIKIIEGEVQKFLAELDYKINELKERYGDK